MPLLKAKLRTVPLRRRLEVLTVLMALRPCYGDYRIFVGLLYIARVIQ